MIDMKLVILESPYAGNVKRHVRYAQLCVFDSLQRGEAPIASHLLYTQMLDDNILEERNWGINAGLAWRKAASHSVVYTDFGITSGMKYGIKVLISIMTIRLNLTHVPSECIM